MGLHKYAKRIRIDKNTVDSKLPDTWNLLKVEALFYKGEEIPDTDSIYWMFLGTFIDRKLMAVRKKFNLSKTAVTKYINGSSTTPRAHKIRLWIVDNIDKI